MRGLRRNQNDFELRPHRRHDDLPSTGRGLPQELKPADRGRDAWVVLIAGSVFEALFWGFPMCFGLFQNHNSNLPSFNEDSSDIALIGTLAQGLYYLGAPFSALLKKRFPKYQRQQISVGWPMCILGLLTASFASSVNGLIATQGILYGLGFVTLTYPIISMINEWWIAREGMAFGLISAASGATGAVMPFIIQALLDRYDYRITLRACAVAMVILTGPLIPMFRGRLPASEEASLARTGWAFLKQPLFWIYGSAILVQGLGFFFPIIFLPSYASSIRIPSIQDTLLLSLISIAQVFGQFALGYLSDKKLNGLVLWGLGKSLGLLATFSVIYGFFAFGFGTLRVAMGRAVSDDPSTVLATYAIFVFLQGVGNVLVGPVSAALMSFKTAARQQYAVGEYDGVVILTGTSSVLAAFIIVSWHGCRKMLEFQ